jgi:methyl-accepting chemotaxis protein
MIKNAILEVQMKSIKTKLVLFSTILVLSITLLIGIIAISIGSNALQKEAKYSLLLLADESAKLTESRLDAMVSILTIISKKSELADMGWEVNLDLLTAELEKTDFIDLGYILPNGYTHYTDGTVRLMSDRAYVKDALAGKARVSDVIISRVTRKPEIEATVPVYKEGEVIGAVIARIEADYLSEITSDIGYGEAGYAYMMNGIGTIIAHPDTQKVISRYNPAEENGDTAYQQILNEKQGVISYQEAGSNIYAGYAPVNGTDWYFVVTASQEEVMSAIPKMLRTIIIVMLIIFLCSMIVVYMVERKITKPLIELTRQSKRIGELDISENINESYFGQKDEIGTLAGAFQNLTCKLRDSIKAISDSANQVSDTALRLTATSQQSALVAEEIVRTVDEIAKGAMEQANHTEVGLSQATILETKLSTNHQYVVELNSATQHVNQLVQKGIEDIELLSGITKENDMATRNTCDMMVKMKQNSSKISEASKIISDMAKQTNLIALNATIEAARAGDAGLGFAVVAREIQSMADQSAESTQYIDRIVSSLQQSIEQAVESMNSILLTSNKQYQSVNYTIERYQNISDAMVKSEAAVEKLNSSEEDMEAANNEIKLMLQSLTAIAEENAAGSQQASSTMEEQSASVQVLAEICEHLSGLSEDLKSVISRFVVEA